METIDLQPSIPVLLLLNGDFQATGTPMSFPSTTPMQDFLRKAGDIMEISTSYLSSLLPIPYFPCSRAKHMPYPYD